MDQKVIIEGPRGDRLYGTVASCTFNSGLFSIGTVLIDRVRSVSSRLRREDASRETETNQKGG
jgi:hypothetical protein